MDGGQIMVSQRSTNKMEERLKFMSGRLIGPLDNLNTMDELKGRVGELKDVYGMWKIGKGSYTRFGSEAVKAVHQLDGKVFLDLKYHDIPNTVEDASHAAADLGVKMFNVHAAGGVRMMEAAVRGAAKSGSNPIIVGVTVLTSIDDEVLNKELGYTENVKEAVLRRAKLCHEAGLDGIVCSVNELEYLKPHLPEDFVYVTPGIKGPDAKAGADQKRVATPDVAIRMGSSYLVCGRAITGHPTPVDRLAAGYKVLESMTSGEE